MKVSHISRCAAIASALALVATGWAGSVSAGGGGAGLMNPGFTYQGELKNAGNAVTGSCDFQFGLWDSYTVGSQIGSTIQLNTVSVIGGLFTVALNDLAQFYPSGVPTFEGDARYLEIATRCPAGSGSFTTLTPRQLLYSAPYALGLLPGARMLGDAYQTLKIQNTTTQTGVPAGVTGEMKASFDGVGVYGSNELTTSGATGMGMWGRTYSPSGVGVKGTGVNGAVGVYAEGSGIGTGHAALYATNTNTGTIEPAGIAIYASSSSADTTIVARNSGTGDVFRSFNSAASAIVYSISNAGKVWASAVQVYGSGDLSVGGPITSGGTVTVGTLGAAGSTTLCRNASNQIAACSSSLRYKSNVADLDHGLDTVAHLRPVAFDWKGTGESDLGFVAEEVDQATPLLATRNAEGQIEGVKYDRISAVLVKAVQEQQEQIAELKARNAALHEQNGALEARLTALEQRGNAAPRAGAGTPAAP